MNRSTRNSQSAISTIANKTYIQYIIDTSASMTYLSSAVKDGLKRFVEDQVKIAKDENRLDTTYFKLVEFNTRKKIRFNGLIGEFKIEDIRILFDGLTRLFDSVSEEVETILKKIKPKKELQSLGVPSSKAVLIVMTDGENNLGSPYPTQMRGLIEKARGQGVICTFMGANQNACETGVEYGFAQDASLTFTPQPFQTVAAMRAVSSGTQRALSKPGQCDIVYSQMERQQSQGTGYIDTIYPLRRANACDSQFVFNDDYDDDYDDDHGEDYHQSKKRRKS
tara:strand:+ start:3408 stop:4247 length:840 start_codon:yes stop_codon:yes gene_type:complete